MMSAIHLHFKMRFLRHGGVEAESMCSMSDQQRYVKECADM